MATIRKLLPYLQSVVALMANMVPLRKKDRLREKRGKEAFAQSTNMILAVSLISFSKFF